jgi:two-component system chemotaxis sensor kinase CheA
VNSDEALLAAGRAAFMDESRDMLAQFESALLALETDPSDSETLNAAFRAAHTIKGSSGLFGYQGVVHFTHEVEAVMDQMRVGTLVVDSDSIALLLRARDEIEAMLEQLAAGNPDATITDANLEQELRDLRGAAALPAVSPAEAGEALGATPARAEAGWWHISVHFLSEALRDGFDPNAFLQYLPRLGTIESVVTLTDRIPPLDEIDPEACYLDFEIRLRSACDRATVEGVFEFAREDCRLRVFEPGAPPEAFCALFEGGDPTLEGNERMRAALLASGSLDAAQIESLRGGGGAPATGAPALLAADEPAAMAVRAGSAGAAAAPEPAPAAAQADPALRKRAATRKSADPRSRNEEQRFLRVAADKLDRLIDLIGELVIAGSGAQLVAREEGSARFAEAAQRIASLVEETRDGALQLRMVQIGETFSRFHRVVRDTARALGKEIDLLVTGGDTELDKSMVEMISDPLMHLVRNAIDHGLELPEEREGAGKARGGNVGLHAYHDSGSIVIEVSDDGRGLDRERIRAKAVERGLIAPGEALTDEQTDLLIFAPGFSTAAAVTDISGRGVGMDVVKRNIEALRGAVRVASQMGRGTTVQIRLPLTLAIIDGFLVEVGASHYIIPLDQVVECIERPRDSLGGFDPSTGYFDLRGEVLPFLDVCRFFRLSSEAAEGGEGGRNSMIVVRYGPHKVGLLVERLLGEYQTVIKPLGKLFAGVRGIAGSTILGSGEVALILDIPALVGSASARTRFGHRTAGVESR